MLAPTRPGMQEQDCAADYYEAAELDNMPEVCELIEQQAKGFSRPCVMTHAFLSSKTYDQMLLRTFVIEHCIWGVLDAMHTRNAG